MSDRASHRVSGVSHVSTVSRISVPTYYKWKSRFAGMNVSSLAQLRELHEENARLKRMYAELALMHTALMDVVERKL